MLTGRLLSLGSELDCFSSCDYNIKALLLGTCVPQAIFSVLVIKFNPLYALLKSDDSLPKVNKYFLYLGSNYPQLKTLSL